MVSEITPVSPPSSVPRSSGATTNQDSPVNPQDQKAFEKAMDQENSGTTGLTQEDLAKFRVDMFVDSIYNNRIEMDKEQW